MCPSSQFRASLRRSTSLITARCTMPGVVSWHSINVSFLGFFFRSLCTIYNRYIFVYIPVNTVGRYCYLATAHSFNSLTIGLAAVFPQQYLRTTLCPAPPVEPVRSATVGHILQVQLAILKLHKLTFSSFLRPFSFEEQTSLITVNRIRSRRNPK